MKPPTPPGAELGAAAIKPGAHRTVKDPTPGPYPGKGAIITRLGETPETRAFRRYPINRHKPRFDK